ncbi:unnamed protein product [Scytosiphon promiscuus]
MFGAARAGLLRACPAVRRSGVLPSAAALTAAPRRCPNAAAFLSLLRSAGEVRSSGLSFSSMTSRPGGDADSHDGDEEGGGGGSMSGEPLPPRTVPDEILGFSCRTYMAGDSDERYPNVHGVHPAEFKVELTVPVPLLELSPAEESRLIQIVGPRYLERRQVLRLVSDRFPNRIDNKRYLVHLLENILVEARNLEDDDHDQAA